jgi:uncharacterized protein YecT (DUF1311 family)
MAINNFLPPKFNRILFLFIGIILFNITANNAIAKISSDNWNRVSNEKIKEICSSVKYLTIPSQDLPYDTEKKIFAKCDSDELYFGFKAPSDYVKARHCSIFKHQEDTLIMIYANGKGVEKNIDLAIHFACQFDAAPAEIEGRINHLIKLKEHPNSKKDFNICDDITSGYMMGYCASLEQRSENEQQKKHINAFIKTLTISEQKAFQPLQNTSKIYFETRLSNELDRYGSGAIAFRITEEINLNNKMIELLNKTIQCKFTSYNFNVYQKADKQLNLLYKKTQNKPDEDLSITKNDIKKTERTWIKYRNSWVKFGRLKCPEVSEDTWMTLITKERIEQLKELTG